MTECLERPCETGYDLMGTSAALRQDLRRFAAWLGDLRVLLVGLLVVLTFVTLFAALGGRAADATPLARAATYSGDDLYDPAAGSLLALLGTVNARAAGYSGDDAYDPAAGARLSRALRGANLARTSFSGDDLYDPAAGSRPALFRRFLGSSLSGDATYDPAAGARPERAFRATDQSFGGDDAYDPAAGGQPALFANRARAAGYGGDDAYDPAAGGIPK